MLLVFGAIPFSGKKELDSVIKGLTTKFGVKINGKKNFSYEIDSKSSMILYHSFVKKTSSLVEY
jgi:hypothetical protein